MPVKIQGKDYVTVAERVAGLHEARNGEMVTIETGIASEDAEQVTMWAKVVTPAGSFSGHARSSKSARSIEGQSPLEVAETSAVGRALGFAGLGIVEGIASADEVKAAQTRARDIRTINTDHTEPKGGQKVIASQAKLAAYMRVHTLKAVDVLRLLGLDMADEEEARPLWEQYIKDLKDNQGYDDEAAYASILRDISA